MVIFFRLNQIINKTIFYSSIISGSYKELSKHKPCTRIFYSFSYRKKDHNKVDHGCVYYLIIK